MYQEKFIADYPAYKITNDGRVLTCFKPKYIQSMSWVKTKSRWIPLEIQVKCNDYPIKE